MVVARQATMWVLVGLFVASSAALADAMPTFKGKGKVTDAIDGDKGAIFDIGGGVTMMFPRGIPVGHSRLVTLQKSRKRPPFSLIHAKFKPLGSALQFDGALNTAGKPIVLSMPMKKDPTRAGTKLVLAMEIATFCEGANKKHKTDKRSMSLSQEAKGDIEGKRRRTLGFLPFWTKKWGKGRPCKFAVNVW